MRGRNISPSCLQWSKTEWFLNEFLWRWLRVHQYWESNYFKMSDDDCFACHCLCLIKEHQRGACNTVLILSQYPHAGTDTFRRLRSVSLKSVLLNWFSTWSPLTLWVEDYFLSQLTRRKLVSDTLSQALKSLTLTRTYWRDGNWITRITGTIWADLCLQYFAH